MNDKPHFAARYSQLADDELARIALLDELLPEAHEALSDELAKRGLTDLGEYKQALEETDAASSLERQLKYQMQVRQALTDWLFAFMAWTCAIAAPFIWLLAPKVSLLDLLKLFAVGGSIIAFSCYLGIKARREGSRTGFWLKCALPLIILGASTLVLLVATLLGQWA